jgi:hypothetical protein
MAAITAGADSLMIEVHPNPAKALSDGLQSLTLEQYEELMQEVAVIGKAVGRWPQNFPYRLCRMLFNYGSWLREFEFPYLLDKRSAILTYQA